MFWDVLFIHQPTNAHCWCSPTVTTLGQKTGLTTQTTLILFSYEVMHKFPWWGLDQKMGQISSSNVFYEQK